MTSFGYQFELFTEKLLKKYIENTELISSPTDRGVDLNISLKGNKYGVEVKVYRTRRISTSVIKNSLLQLQYNLSSNNYSGGLLVTTVNIEPSIRKDLESEFKIQIIDRGILLFLTKNDEILRSELESILLDISQTGEDDIYEGIFAVDSDYTFQLIENDGSTQPLISKGKDLCLQLKSINPGKEESKDFEKKCEEVLKYLFATDFTNWQPQNKTVDTLHIFDLIAKISSTNDFWKSLARDFNSRFVIFEFKNYTDEIKQGQIYTTEKYLYKTALRGIAIIISRKGADKNAITAMEGSLREYGKLIISLDLEEICKMLNMKDNGDDPNTYLSEKIDSILMKLSR